MNSRDAILSRIRAAQGRAGAPSAPETAAVATYIAAHPSGPRPPSDWDPLQRLRERALSLTTTLDEVADLAAVPAAVARYLRNNQLPLNAVCWAELAALDWTSAGLQIEARETHGNDLVGITGAFCAIAETGTLMLPASPQRPTTLNLLCDTEIVVLRASRVVGAMEEAWDMLRYEREGMVAGNFLPRNVMFVTGPSRSADIESTLELGAHGPRRLHVVLIDDTAG